MWLSLLKLKLKIYIMNVLKILLNIYSKMLSSLVGVPVGDFFIGSYYFSKQKCALVLRGKEIHCTHQDCLLLIAFMESEDRFLSYEEIAKTCLWPSEVCGLNERRRTAVSQLRKLFIDSTVEIKSVRNRRGYQLTVVKRRKNGSRFSHAFLTFFSRFI